MLSLKIMGLTIVILVQFSQRRPWLKLVETIRGRERNRFLPLPVRTVHESFQLIRLSVISPFTWVLPIHRQFICSFLGLPCHYQHISRYYHHILIL